MKAFLRRKILRPVHHRRKILHVRHHRSAHVTLAKFKHTPKKHVRKYIVAHIKHHKSKTPYSHRGAVRAYVKRHK